MYEIGADPMHGWPGMAKVIEEMGELHTVMAKIMSGKGAQIYWDGTDLLTWLLQEAMDVKAAIDFFLEINEGRFIEDAEPDFKEVMRQRYRYKHEKFHEWQWRNLLEAEMPHDFHTEQGSGDGRGDGEETRINERQEEFIQGFIERYGLQGLIVVSEPGWHAVNTDPEHVEVDPDADS